MESYNNLTELRRAEQSTEAEARYQSMSGDNIHPTTDHSYANGNTILPNSNGGSWVPVHRIPRPLSPASRASKSENEDLNSGGETDDGDDDYDKDDDDDDDDDSPKSEYENDQDGTKFAGDTSNEGGLVSKSSFRPQSSSIDGFNYTIHRESKFLLQMVPYRPKPLHQVNSDHLIPYRQGPDSGTHDSAQEATNSIRLLLDKWTKSGSAPVSKILDEEAAKDKSIVSVRGSPFLRACLTFFL